MLFVITIHHFKSKNSNFSIKYFNKFNLFLYHINEIFKFYGTIFSYTAAQLNIYLEISTLR